MGQDEGYGWLFEQHADHPLWMIQLGDMAVVGRSPTGANGSICYTVLNPKTGITAGPSEDLLNALEEAVQGVDWGDLLRRMHEEVQEDPFDRLESVAIAIETLSSAGDLREQTRKALTKGATRIRMSVRRLQTRRPRVTDGQVDRVADAVFRELADNGFAGRDPGELREALVTTVRRIVG